MKLLLGIDIGGTKIGIGLGDENGKLCGDVDFEKDVVIYEDEGFSGYYTKRPAFQEMMEAVKILEIIKYIVLMEKLNL